MPGRGSKNVHFLPSEADGRYFLEYFFTCHFHAVEKKNQGRVMISTNLFYSRNVAMGAENFSCVTLPLTSHFHLVAWLIYMMKYFSTSAYESMAVRSLQTTHLFSNKQASPCSQELGPSNTNWDIPHGGKSIVPTSWKVVISLISLHTWEHSASHWGSDGLISGNYNNSHSTASSCWVVLLASKLGPWEAPNMASVGWIENEAFGKRTSDEF